MEIDALIEESAHLDSTFASLPQGRPPGFGLRLHTKDLGGNACTEEVTNAVCALVAQNASKPSHLKETA
jgi:hypothetical protein